MSTIEALNSQLLAWLEDFHEILQNPMYNEDELQDVLFETLDPLDVLSIVSETGTVYGHQILITYGGPNIYIDTLHSRIFGHWGTTFSSYPIPLKISTLIEERYN